ncbi:MAG: nucleotidyltransferase domain-containing protein [Eubacteriales bacterium]|nr:nucleotidyltransferase domain-containing protein [Eubacteriales bacterium]MDD3073978.1 nucleotidyltransferase domain-containing protein [Eubacteriales bacterium]MDD4078841.1 nucleotidyltransferase domain-containing protein [Eubacteriales bacterium]
MSFGLIKSDLDYIIDSIKKHREIERASIFGSRAKGNYRPGSDVDIAVFGNNITLDTLSALTAALNDEGPLPYYFDIVDYSSLDQRDLIEHIDRVGKTIFVAASATRR